MKIPQFLLSLCEKISHFINQMPDRNAKIRQSPIERENPYKTKVDLKKIKQRLDQKVQEKAKGNVNKDANIFNHPRR